MKYLVQTLTARLNHIGRLIQKRFIAWTKLAKSSLVAGAVSDLPKSKAELMAENALLRKQLIILNRQVKTLPYPFGSLLFGRACQQNCQLETSLAYP